MFDFLKNLFKPKFTPGVVKDPRSPIDKSKDYPHEELAAAFTAPVWKVNPPENWSKLSIRNQNGSSTCVGQAVAKAYEMFYGEPYSALPIYTNRKNRPQPGMWLQDAGDIAKKIGTVPERLLPSQFMTEAQCNVPVNMSNFVPSAIKKVKAYIFVNPRDIDAIAQVLDAGYAMVLTFESNYQEWTSIPKYNSQPYQFGHCVCDPKDRTLWTDNNYQNMKAIVVDESWGVGINADGVLPVDGKRLITEDFLKKRCTGAMYLIFEEVTVPTPKPKHIFERNLAFGLRNDPDVKALQACLAYLGLFPKDKAFHTGNYFQYTKKAVSDLQWRYKEEILTPAGLNSPTGFVGSYTRSWLNKNFS